ncbi:MAG: hypothetical protein Q9223_000824 [Gallowayella weberi]
MAEASGLTKAEASVQQHVVSLCNLEKATALAKMNEILKTRDEAKKLKEEAEAISKDDISRFNAKDLAILQSKYSRTAHFDAQLKQVNRSLLGGWKQRVKSLLSEEERKHLNKKTIFALREWAAWFAIICWLSEPSNVYKAPAEIIEMCLRAEWVDTNAHTLLWLIRTDTWTEDLDVFQTA